VNRCDFRCMRSVVVKGGGVAWVREVDVSEEKHNTGGSSGITCLHAAENQNINHVS